MTMNKKDLCKNIQNNVSRLTNIEIIELFKIILETGENYTKNNNGVFINLNWLNDETLNKINDYISFCIKSQNEITKYELMKSLLNESITSKDIDTNEKKIEPDIVDNSLRQKFSSSMKFYLLKKKFMKQNIISVNVLENELKYEDYVIT
jgi:hypothetical protein